MEGMTMDAYQFPSMDEMLTQLPFKLLSPPRKWIVKDKTSEELWANCDSLWGDFGVTKDVDNLEECDSAYGSATPSPDLEAPPFEFPPKEPKNPWKDFVLTPKEYPAQPKVIITWDIEAREGGLFTMKKPWGIAVNPTNEHVYVADRELHQVLVYAPDGEFVRKFGKPGEKEGQFNRPTGLGWDTRNNRILVVDKDNHRIQAFTPEGIFLDSVGLRGKKEGQFYYPWGIAVSPNGNFVIADSRNRRLQLFSQDFKFKAILSNESSGIWFDHPRGLAFDPTGEWLYMSDFNLHSVFRIPGDLGKKPGTMGILRHQFYRPSGLSVNQDGKLYVVDTRNNAVKIFNSDGTPLVVMEVMSNGMKIESPLDVATFGRYAALIDCNGRIRIF